MRGKKTEIRNPPKKSRSLKGQNKDLKRISQNNRKKYIFRDSRGPENLRSYPKDADKSFLTSHGIKTLKETNKALKKGLGEPARSAKAQNKISKNLKKKRNPLRKALSGVEKGSVVDKVLSIWD